MEKILDEKAAPHATFLEQVRRDVAFLVVEPGDGGETLFHGGSCLGKDPRYESTVAGTGWSDAEMWEVARAHNWAFYSGMRAGAQRTSSIIWKLVNCGALLIEQPQAFSIEDGDPFDLEVPMSHSVEPLRDGPLLSFWDAWDGKDMRQASERPRTLDKSEPKNFYLKIALKGPWLRERVDALVEVVRSAKTKGTLEGSRRFKQTFHRLVSP